MGENLKLHIDYDFPNWNEYINLERKILKTIFEKYQDKTIIIVSHRLENMDLYKKVINLKDGKIDKIANLPKEGDYYV